MEPKFKCPSCRAKMRAEKELGGQEVRCPNCSEAVLVPKVSYEEGEVIAGFQLVAWIGSGSMGEVYKARQLSMDREVAIKLLRPDMLEDSEHIERFNSEVRMLAKLDHPNIVTAFEAGQFEEHYFLAMSFVSGYNLDECLLDRDRLKEKEVVKVAIKVAQALNYAWSRFQILHRDVKPSNIMIDEDGEVKLTDVGIAMRVGEDLDPTQSGFVVGTPFYMSPEQASDTRDLDFSSDMFSLGATLFHLVTGEAPFDGDTATEIMLRVINEDVADPRTVNPEVSEPTARIIMKMMARKRAERFASWDEMIEAAQRIVRGETGRPAAATPRKRPKLKTQIAPPASLPTAVPAGTSSSGMNGWIIALAALVGLSILVLVIVQMNQRGSPGAGDLLDPLVSDMPPLDDPGGTAPPPPTPPPDTPPTPPEPEGLTVAQRQRLTTMMEAAAAWFEQNPHDYEGTMARYRVIIDEARHSPFEDQAWKKLQTVDELYQDHLQAVRRRLTRRAEKLANDGELERAVEAFTEYDGELQEETATWRARSARPYRERLEQETERARAASQAARRLWREELQKVANDFLGGRIGGAQSRLERMSQDEALAPLEAEIEELIDLFAGLRDWQEELLRTFAQDADKELAIQLKTGRQELLIKGVDGHRIKAMRQVNQGRLGVTLSLSDLAFAEIYRRLRENPQPSVQLALGLMCLRDNQPERAAAIFSTFAPQFSQSLLRALHAESPGAVEPLAYRLYLQALEAAGLNPDASMLENYATLISEPRDGADMEKAAEIAKELRRIFSYTRAAQENLPLVRLLIDGGDGSGVWPHDRTGLVLMWGSPGGADMVRDPLTGTWREVQLSLMDGARAVQSQGIFFPGGGAHAVPKVELGEMLLAACRASGELTVELVIAPDRIPQTGPARILSYSTGTDHQQLMIGQEGDLLEVRLDVDGRRAFRTETVFREAGEWVHVVVTYSKEKGGNLRIYVNGRQMVNNIRVSPGFSEWQPMTLIFGNEVGYTRGWIGTLGRVAIYARGMEVDEVKERYDAYVEEAAK